ncbi:MAG TPA: cytochrome c-type biogenesis protein CcmH [Gemmatimonadaceae bacterium]|nr:cytochrome c-type biogenesis protein CcmH [Gemmatimonadaceae bacterium]
MSDRSLSRRDALRAGVTAVAILVARGAMAQGTAADSTGAPNAPTDGSSGSNLFSMNQGAARTVQRRPKPGATPHVSDAERDEVEKKLRCQCGCTLDVYTCRTTDFACEVSPAMHRDINALIEGGYGAQEIIDAFVDSYGEKVLMAPTKSGFNLVGWTMPFGAILVGGGVLAVLIRRWRRRGAVAAAERAASTGPRAAAGGDASAEELARVEAAVRGDGR